MKNNQLSPATYLSGEPMTLASLIANGIVGACPECGSKEICTHDSLSPATPAMRTDPLPPLLGLTMAEGISDVLFGSCRGSEGARNLYPSNVSGFDYTNQAWVENGRYVACSHHTSEGALCLAATPCECFGRLHEGEQFAPNAEIH